MRRYVFGTVVILAFALLLCGCGTQAANVTETYAPATESALPVKTPEPDKYAIEGQTIVRERNGEKTVVYDVTEHFPGNYECWVNCFAAASDALYISEGGEPADSDTYRFQLVRTDSDDSNRTVLYPDTGDYTQIVLYGSRIFFVEDEMADLSIGWANMDGSGSDYLNIPDNSTADSEEQYLEQATLYIKDGMLYADVGLSPDVAYAEVTTQYTVRINEDLSVERMDG